MNDRSTTGINEVKLIGMLVPFSSNFNEHSKNVNIEIDMFLNQIDTGEKLGQRREVN